MPPHLPLVERLLRKNAQGFAGGMSLPPGPARRAWKVARFRRLRKLERLLSELSPRTEFIERWVDELTDVADEMPHLVRRYKDATNWFDRAKRGAGLGDG